MYNELSELILELYDDDISSGKKKEIMKQLMDKVKENASLAQQLYDQLDSINNEIDEYER